MAHVCKKDNTYWLYYTGNKHDLIKWNMYIFLIHVIIYLMVIFKDLRLIYVTLHLICLRIYARKYLARENPIRI